MRELSVIEERAAKHKRDVEREACDRALDLISVALGSLKDEIVTKRQELLCKSGTLRSIDILASVKAAKLGQELWKTVCEQLWNELPFRAADLVAQADPDDKLINAEFSVEYVNQFIESLKPCTK